jgi:parallel beta-helix repeat protein
MPEIGERRVRTATFVVAASDSMVQDKAMADYVCTGTNDHLVIQAALDALPATGGEVKLLEGTYNIEVSPVMDSYQTLTGCGYNTVLTTSTALSGLITAAGGAGTEKQGIVVSDLRIDAASTAYAGIYWDYVDNSEIRNVWVHDCTTNKGITEWGGIQLLNCDFDKIAGNRSYDNLEYGIQLGDFLGGTGSCTGILLEDNICLQNGISNIWLYDSSNNTVVGNIIQGNSLSIYLITSDNNTIMGNIIQSTSTAIYLDNSSGNTVASNIIQTTSDGIALDSSNDNTITANNCLGCDTGIDLNSSDNNTIVGNTLNTGNYGIQLSGNNNTMVGNIIQGNNNIGIYSPSSDSSNNAITGNTIQGNSEAGILIVGSHNNAITGNAITENGEAAIQFSSSCDNNTISGNTIKDNGSGIIINESDNNTIVGNTLIGNSQTSDNTKDNIYLYDSDYNLIADNTCRRGTLANKTRYGINIANAACDHNMVHGNNLYDSGTTGDLNDAGTNTHKRDNLSNAGAWLADV